MSEVLVDTHKHFAHRCFNLRRNEILRELIDNGVVAEIEGAIEFAGNQKMKFLCDKYAHVFMAAGCHPNCVEEMDDEKYQAIASNLNCLV